MPEPWFPLPLALAPPREKTGKLELIAPLPTFALELLETDKLRMKLGLDMAYSAFENLQNIYKGMSAGEKSGESGTLGIKYVLNSGVTKSPSEVLATGKGDCDEITRLAFLSASGLGAQNAVMVEMTWTNPKTKLFEGHSALVLIPENPLDAPLVFDFTYLHDGKQLESADLEKGLKKFYAEDAKNPDFKIAQFGTVTEVEASYYDKVGWQYSTIGNWEMTALAYEKAVGLVPDGFEYNRNLGFTYKKLKKYEKALEYYKKASETKEGKEDTETYSNIGDIYLSLKRYEEAGQTLKLALSLNPNRTLYETIGHNLATAMFKEGKRLMNEKKHDDALAHFNEALQYLPSNEDIKHMIKLLETKTR